MSFYWYLLCYSRTPPQVDSYWFLRQLWKPDKMVGGIPCLTLPTDWSGGWRSLWHSVLKEFLPYTMRESWQQVENMPANEKQWKQTVDDSTLKAIKTRKRCELPLTAPTEFYSVLTDIYGWALRHAMHYYRHRVGSDVPDVLFYERPKSQQGCAHLVKVFFELAQARQLYHLHIHHNAGGLTQTKGRPRKLRMGRHADEDLWLILIWPLALRKAWTYQDVERALRLHFGRDRSGCPPPATPREAVAESLKSGCLPECEREWCQTILKVTRHEKKAMRARCQSLGLSNLPRRARSHPDVEAKPPYFDLVNRFENWQGGLASCDFEASRKSWDAWEKVFARMKGDHKRGN